MKIKIIYISIIIIIKVIENNINNYFIIKKKKRSKWKKNLPKGLNDLICQKYMNDKRDKVDGGLSNSISTIPS